MRREGLAIMAVGVIVFFGSTVAGSLLNCNSIANQCSVPTYTYMPLSGATVSVQIESASGLQSAIGRPCFFSSCTTYSSMSPSSLTGTSSSGGSVSLTAPSSYGQGSGFSYFVCNYDSTTGANDLSQRAAAWWPILLVYVNGAYAQLVTTGYGISCPSGSNQTPPSLPATPQWPQSLQVNLPPVNGVVSYVTLSISSTTATTSSTTPSFTSTTTTISGTATAITYPSPSPPPSPAMSVYQMVGLALVAVGGFVTFRKGGH